MSGVLGVFYGDTHPNSKAGLCPSTGVALDSGGTYLPSELQMWYWTQWTHVWAAVKNRAAKLRAQIWAFQLGDGADDNSHDAYGLISKNEADIMRVALAVQEPVVQTASRLFIFRGTGAHVHGYGSLEEMAALVQACRSRKMSETSETAEGVMLSVGATEPHRCEIVQDPATDTFSWFHGLFDIEKVLVSCAHHSISYARRPWTVGGGAARSAAELAFTYSGDSEIADYAHKVAFRAHGHYMADSGHTHPWRMFYCRPWQAQTDFGYRLGHTEVQGPGVWLVHFDNGRYQAEPLNCDIPRSDIWKAE